VDAAWAGAGACSPRVRGHLAGIERADSVTVDAHKWLSVPMGAGMLLTPHATTLAVAFTVHTGYMPPPVDGVAADPYTTSMQWSRRAAGLKLLLTLAVHGRAGYAAQIERDVALGDRLRAELGDDGWQVVNHTPLPVVCAVDPRHDGDVGFHETVAAAVVASGDAWISPVRLAGRPAVRACVISHRTTEADLDLLVTAMHEARAQHPD
jgi:aromatic-L-amino-acid/L-tryptophan decarboxylase